jgi:hypothetical protein
VSNWTRIRDYQRAAWKTQAVDMDALGLVNETGSSGTDNGPTNHNLSSTVQDALGRSFTATSVGDPVTGITGTISGLPDVETILDDGDPLTGDQTAD